MFRFFLNFLLFLTPGFGSGFQIRIHKSATKLTFN
jgi:hypothetical protein